MSLSWSRTLVGSTSSLIVWAAHFTLVYVLVGLGCEQGWHRSTLAGGNLLTVLLVAVTIPALALIVWIGSAGWRWQRRTARRGSLPVAAERSRFMGLLTFVVALVAFVATLMTALPVAMLPPCELN